MILARGLAVLAAAGLMSVAAPAQELKPVKIGVVNLSTDVAFYIAEKRGYFKAEGLKADFAYFDSGAKMIVPLGTGALDTGGGATSAGFYNAVDRGIELRIVADKGMSVDGYDYKALVVRKDLIDSGAFKSLADLKGKKVAVVAQGAADEVGAASGAAQGRPPGRRHRAGVHPVLATVGRAAEQGHRRGDRGRTRYHAYAAHGRGRALRRVCPSSIRTRPPMSSTAANSRKTRRPGSSSSRPICARSATTTVRLKNGKLAGPGGEEIMRCSAR